MFTIPHRNQLTTRGAGVLIAWLLAAGQTQAASIVLDIPSIAGSDDRPGHPIAIALDSLQFTKNGFVDRRHVDADTTALQLAFGKLEKLGTISVAIYKFAAPDMTPASVSVTYPDALISALSITSVGGFLQETDTFNSPKPGKMKYVVHEGGGSSFDLAFTTADLSGNTLTLSRTVDAGTQALQNDLATGTPLSADLLLYSDDTSMIPSDTINFSGVMVSSLVTQGGTGTLETDVFTFTDLSQPIPEPASAVLILTAIGSFAAFRLRNVVVARLKQ